MQKLEILRRNVKNAEDLQSIVRTMKVMAAIEIHQFEQAVESLGEYYDTLEKGFQIVLSKAFWEVHPFLYTDEYKEVGLIVLGSGMAMCGSFDETIASYTMQQIEEGQLSGVRLFVLGQRLSGYLGQQQLTIDQTFEMPGAVDGINSIVLELLSAIELWQQEKNIRSIMVIHNKPVLKKDFAPRTQYLLPLNQTWLDHLVNQPWPTNNLPQFTLESDRLFMSLLRQYLFVSLFRAVAESLAAEYSSRLSAMQRAEQKIEERLEQLKQAFTNERQTVITDELLDIMAGFEAVQSQDKF